MFLGIIADREDENFYLKAVTPLTIIRQLSDNRLEEKYTLGDLSKCFPIIKET